MASAVAASYAGKSAMPMAPHPPSMMKPRGRFRIDPQRALEPTRKKLNTVEAQRIMAALQDSIRRIELLTALPYLLDNVDRYKIALGSELCGLLESHKVIIETFEELKLNAERLLQGDAEQDDVEYLSDEMDEDDQGKKSESVHSGGSSNGSPTRPSSAESIGTQTDEILRSLTMVARQMQSSCKNITRAFGINPAAASAILRDAGVEREENSEELISEMNALKDILMGKLLTTPVEDDDRAQYLREISERERHNAGIIGKLDSEVRAATDDKEQEIKKKNDVIRRLQADLHQIQKFSEEHIKRTKSEAEKQEVSDVKNSEGKKGKLQQDVTQLRTQLQALTTEHRESEQILRKKKFKIETEVENWIQKYDQDMGERQDEYEEIDGVYTEEKKQLNELEERFKLLQTEYDQIMEERRIAREKREAAERELQMSVGAATTIQAFWRSYKVRKALKGKKKKGKGKKGKK